MDHFSTCECLCVCVCVCARVCVGSVASVMSDSVQLCATTACEALSFGFSRLEYWSGLPFPSSGDLSDPGMEPTSLALAGRFFTAELRGKHFDHNYQDIKRNRYHDINYQDIKRKSLCKTSDSR